MGILRGCIIKGVYIIEWIYLKKWQWEYFCQKKSSGFFTSDIQTKKSGQYKLLLWLGRGRESGTGEDTRPASC